MYFAVCNDVILYLNSPLMMFTSFIHIASWFRLYQRRGSILEFKTHLIVNDVSQRVRVIKTISIWILLFSFQSWLDCFDNGLVSELLSASAYFHGQIVSPFTTHISWVLLHMSYNLLWKKVYLFICEIVCNCL